MIRRRNAVLALHLDDARGIHTRRIHNRCRPGVRMTALPEHPTIWRNRMNRRLRSAAALIAALSFTMAACSGGYDSSSTATTATGATSASGTAGGTPIDTLRTAFYNDMQVPDPDVFYAVEGNQVTMRTYEGLLRYKLGGTTELEPLLA